MPLTSFVGSDTTAIAMRAVFYYLMTNPDQYHRLVTELDAAAAERQLSSPVKYNEAMRLHPSIGLTLPRVIPEGGISLCGRYIPAGYVVGVNGAVVRYDRTIFGVDADKFRPSRWVDGDATTMDKCMLHFGAGTRTCIGKNVSTTPEPARQSIPLNLRSRQEYPGRDKMSWLTLPIFQVSMSEIHKLMPQVLRHFSVELADPEKPWKSRNLWFNKQTSLIARLKRRETAAADTGAESFQQG